MIGSKKLTTLAALAGVAVLTTSAQAFMVDDAKILIDRALNSPTLTIKYSGASATLVELKINGTSFGTRQVTGKSSGETNFTLDLSMLADGDNEVEVRLYDKEGKLVGSEKTNITAKSGEKGPVFLVNPKMGSTVRGTLDIKVGFGKDLKDTYVSFFTDNQFRSMTNNPPYSFLWDTTRENNGWHEIEAWVVTGGGDTYKTNKVKVFVDNGQGRTNRPLPATISNPPVNPPTTQGNTGIKVDNSGLGHVVENVHATVPSVVGALINNPVKGITASTMGLKPTDTGDQGIMMGQRNIAPGETTVPAAKVNPGIKITKPADPVKHGVIDIKNTGVGHAASTTNSATATNATGMISVVKGQRINVPNMSPLTISLNSNPLNFDVMPRVQDGIPLTPFRHLLESQGGKVDWDNLAKALSANAVGKDIWLKIGDKMARVNKIDVELEIAPFLERGRTIVPLSFIHDSLDVDVQYDPATGHVLITKAKKN